VLYKKKHFAEFQEGGETTKFDGEYLSILEKQGEGFWKIARDCFNNNALPSPSEKE